MKMFIILGSLIIALPAAAVRDKNYQYKDLSSKNARPFDGIQNKRGTDSDETQVTHKKIQKQEEKRVKDRSEDAREK
jgi:hypothetical protein